MPTRAEAPIRTVASTAVVPSVIMRPVGSTFVPAPASLATAPVPFASRMRMGPAAAMMPAVRRACSWPVLSSPELGEEGEGLGGVVDLERLGVHAVEPGVDELGDLVLGPDRDVGDGRGTRTGLAEQALPLHLLLDAQADLGGQDIEVGIAGALGVGRRRHAGHLPRDPRPSNRWAGTAGLVLIPLGGIIPVCPRPCPPSPATTTTRPTS